MESATVVSGEPTQGTDSMFTLRLQLACSYYQVSGIPHSWQKLIPKKLLGHQLEQATVGVPSHQLRLRLVPDSEHLRPPNIGHDLNETSQFSFHSKSISYESDWCEGRLHLGVELVMNLDCHPEAEACFAGVLENALRLMVAYDVLRRGGLLMHSSAIVINDNASILFGHSGAGKSTTSQIAMDNGYSVLSDDINVLLPIEGGWQVIRVPFCGTLDAYYEGPGAHPLTGLFRLQKHGEHSVGDFSAAEAMSQVCGSAPFVNQDPYRLELLLDTIEQIIGSCPVKKLYFRRDKGFLDLIGEDR
jgi:hypothetical protein